VTEASNGEQLSLAGMPSVRRRKPLGGSTVAVAERLPVALVYIDLPPAHLDHTFEYLVPASMDEAARPGTRVKVRFGAQDVDGFLVDRREVAEFEGRLAPLRRVVSPEVVLVPQVLRLARSLADHYAGTLVDVLRLAIPPRHARVEAEATAPVDDPTPGHLTVSAGAWADYRGGAAFLQHLSAGTAPRAVWTALPGIGPNRWSRAIAEAVAATVAGGRGALVVLPDARDVEEVATALTEVGLPAWARGSEGGHARLVADDGPAQRYRSFLAVLRGDARVAIGTRSAAFAPVHDLGLVVCWDDRDEMHQEPRAPYVHVREVLTRRSSLEECGALLGSVTRSTQAQLLVEQGWAHSLQGDRAAVRRRTPRVRALTSVELAREGAAATARLPGEALRVLRAGLANGPVLIQVPRAGYVPIVACGTCRTVARCATCHGPLGVQGAAGGHGTPQCSWCGRLATAWRCTACGSATLRAVGVGSERTAEELGRAFPGVTVRVSGAGAPGGVLADIADRPALVVSTIGAEPRCASGYTVAALLDAATSTSRASLQVGEQALHRWLAAASLVRPADDGGTVLLIGDAAPTPTQALVRWDPVGFAERELAERRELGLPPAVRVAALTGTRDAVAAVVGRLDLPPGAQVLGPVPVDGPAGAELSLLEQEVRAVVRAPLGVGDQLSRTLKSSLAVRSARRESGSVRVQVDPAELL
jgi:primosomal protein N' (replication factor Y)